jgi:hypothetical protein
MGKIRLFSIIVFLLAGCATARYSWEHPDSDYRSANYKSDLAVCKEYSVNAAFDLQDPIKETYELTFGDMGKPTMLRHRDISPGLKMTYNERQAFESCMAEKGWYKVRR